MKIHYDPAVDALSIRLRDAEVANTDELEEGVIADYDAEGRIIALEVLDASQRVTRPDRVEFPVLGAGEPIPA